MRFPWVSREWLEDVKRQLAKSEAERERLLDLLSERIKPTPVPARPVLVEEDKSRDVAQGTVKGFTTPFDRIGAKFDKVPTTDKARFLVR